MSQNALLLFFSIFSLTLHFLLLNLLLKFLAQIHSPCKITLLLSLSRSAITTWLLEVVDDCCKGDTDFLRSGELGFTPFHWLMGFAAAGVTDHPLFAHNW